MGHRRLLATVLLAASMILAVGVSPAAASYPMPKPTTITGRVTHHGVGVSGVYVQFATGGRLANGAWRIMSMQTRTKADGTYSVKVLAPGIASAKIHFYTAQDPMGNGAFPDVWWDSAPDWESARAVPLASDGSNGSAVCDQELVHGGAVEGTVTVTPGYQNAVPFGGVGSWAGGGVYLYHQSGDQWMRIWPQSGWMRPITPTTSHFIVFGVLPGTYRVLAEGAGRQDHDLLPQVYPSVISTSVATSGAADIAVTNETTTTIDMSMQRGGHIVGTMTDPDGKPTGGSMTVYTADGRGLKASNVTDSRFTGGAFDVRGLLGRAWDQPQVVSSTGDYVLYVVPSNPDLKPFWYGGTSKATATPIHVVDGQDTTVTLATQIRPLTLTTPGVWQSYMHQSLVFVWGDIYPLQPAGQRTVRLMLEHREHGKWVYTGSVSATPKTTKRHYSTLIKLGKMGLWRIRAKHQDSSHPKAVYSAGYGYVTLR